MKPTSLKNFWQTFIASSILLSGLAIYQTVQQVSTLDIIFWRSKWILLVGIFTLNILVGIFALGKLSRDNDTRWIKKLELAPKNKWIGFVLVVSVVFSMFFQIYFLTYTNKHLSTHIYTDRRTDIYI